MCGRYYCYAMLSMRMIQEGCLYIIVSKVSAGAVEEKEVQCVRAAAVGN